MSYSFFAWTTDEAPGPEEMADQLSSAAADDVDVECSSARIMVRSGEWALRGSVNDASWVAEEASEIVSMINDLTDQQRALLAEASSRVEFEPAGGDTDDHYNTWLFTAEALADLPGVLVFFPFDATVMG